MNYNKVKLDPEGIQSCVGIGIYEHKRLMKGAVKADKNRINNLVKKQIPSLYESLALNCYNPYNYYRTKTHLILIHSSIEYFIPYQT